MTYTIPLASAQQDTVNFLTYTSTDLGFTIKYPSDWNVDESNAAEGSVKFMSPDRGGFLVVSVSNRPNEANVSPEDFVKNFTSHIVGFRPIEANTNNYFLSGHPAARIIGIQGFGRPGEPGASQGIEPHDVQMMLLITALEGKGYSVGYGSAPETFNDYLQAAQSMINSFQTISKQ